MCSPRAPLPCTGRGENLLSYELDNLRVLLSSGHANALLSALFTIGRVVYLEVQDDALGRVSNCIVAADLLHSIVHCMSHDSYEVRSHAAVALALLCRDGASLLESLKVRPTAPSCDIWRKTHKVQNSELRSR